MNCRPNQLCRCVGLIGLDAVNNQAIVHTEYFCENCGRWHCTALQGMVVSVPLLGNILFEYTKIKAGATVSIQDQYLRPLGGSGPEERDLFNLPKPQLVPTGRWTFTKVTK